MAIISGAKALKKETIKLEINTKILEQIKSYCEWSEIFSMDCFIEEASCFIFAKDKEWKKHQKAIKRSRKNKNIEKA